MTTDEIKEYIDRLNNGNGKETIFLREISEFVKVAKVWKKELNINDSDSINLDSYRFFFIQNKNKKYVGAVLDMGFDLHWFILENERKKGYLTNALKRTILPYIFYSDNDQRDSQTISIESGIGKKNYSNSRKVAENLGFIAINIEENKFELNKNDFDWELENVNEKNNKISKERFEELRKRLTYSSKNLMRISDELIMSYDDDRELKELADKVKYFQSKIDDIEFDYNIKT